MSDSIKSVIDNLSNQTAVKSQSTSDSSSLDKDSFLQLLVTQMKYQDPLNPSSDTQFVEQLATFSQLEQMQNLNQTYSNSQAFGLIGMNVVLGVKDSSGNEINKSGIVDSVVMSNGSAKLIVDGSPYTLDQIKEVIDSNYLIKQGLPNIPKAVDVTFDKEEPQDITFEVDMGKNDTVATNVAVILNGEVVDSDKISIKDNKVTISKDVFENLENGTYKPTLVFDDPLYTTITDKITIRVKGESADDGSESGDDSESGEDTDNESGEGSDDTV